MKPSLVRPLLQWVVLTLSLSIAAPASAQLNPAPAGNTPATTPETEAAAPVPQAAASDAAPPETAATAPAPPEGCRPLSDKAMAADLKAVTARSQKLELAEQARLYKEAEVYWSKAVEFCDGRPKERAQRNLLETQKVRNSLVEQMESGPECAAAHKDALSLQELAKTALGERRWTDAATLFHKSEDMWDLASERCTGSQHDIATRKREEAETDGYNAEFCAPAFAKALEQTQKMRAQAAGQTREEKQEASQLAETMWREAAEQCRGKSQDTARNNAQAVAAQRGTPWIARALAAAVAKVQTSPKPAPTTAATAATTPVIQAPKAPAVQAQTAATAAPSSAGANVPPVPATATKSAPAIVAASAGTAATVAAGAATATGAATPSSGIGGSVSSVFSSLGNAVASITAPLTGAIAGTAAASNQPEPQPPEFTAGTTRFSGQFVRDADSPTYSGKGKMVWANGDVFDGTLQKSQRHGKGLFIWANGQRYDGDWVNDQQTGQARVQFVNGNRYEGTVVDGVPHGQGRMAYASGDTYEGQLKTGTPEGRGVYVWKNGQQFDGEWKDGRPNGKGRLKFAGGDVYEGTVLNGVPHQEGTFTWTNGDKYTGQWKSGKKHGQGKFTWASGELWEGTYENDQQKIDEEPAPKK